MESIGYESSKLYKSLFSFRQHFKKLNGLFIILLMLIISGRSVFAQGTRLLRQPTFSSTHIAFGYGGDLWAYSFADHETVRLTSTPAVEADPHFSPDGKTIAFTSNRSGVDEVYTVPVEGGEAKRITWHPSPSYARGWTPDGKRILFSSTRETAPTSIERLWTISPEGGPATLLTSQWGTNGSYSPDGQKIVIDRVSRWDKEWRDYRGGQNTALDILTLNNLSESFIPNERTMDIQPVWLGDVIYFLSDRDWVMNIWSYTPGTGEVNQLTKFTGADIKWLAGKGDTLAFEREGYLHLLDLKTGNDIQLDITVKGDFPWAETKWEDVSKSAQSVSLSPTGKRAVMEARGEIFTVPVENGDVRDLTQSSGVADRRPVWSPRGDKIAWFSDANKKNYALMIGGQDGLTEPKSISIGISKLAWEPAWSPDGKYIAFDDDDVRIRVVDVESGEIKTIDTGGTNIERGSMGLTWSPDSKWLAYSKTGANNFRSITLWSVENDSIKRITNSFADAFSPSWDLDGKHLYFLASTDLALGSGWANTSSITSEPEYEAYVINLRKEDDSPFKLRSDEEKAEVKKPEGSDQKKKAGKEKKKESGEKEAKKQDTVRIDFTGIERRTIPLPIPKRNYRFTINGPEGTVFIGEQKPESQGLTIQKFTLEKRKAEEYITGASQVSVSGDGEKMLAKIDGSWKVMDTSKPNGKDGTSLKVDLKMNLNRLQEWQQIFEEAWRYERDYFYNPDMDGRDWNVVHERYAPLVPYIEHRADLTYVLDQVNGELSVGHSFVFGGDYPEVEKNTGGLLGANLVVENNRWKIQRIFTTENWNPELSSPLDEPGLKVKEGDYMVGINGKEITGDDNPYRFLDGTAGIQTVLYVNDKPSFEGYRKIIVKPIRSENALRQRAWVEDNRRLVDSLSNGKLAYVWVPNTGGSGFISFNRYFFAQQDKDGAVIDERFNGGGLLDDYMVDLMKRKLRAAVTNEVPDGKPFRLPAGILGPKVLLINEMSGSGGDFFPWVFRQQKIGPLIGTRTWGGLVKSSVHYNLVDGGALTAPDNAVYDPVNHQWIAENKGIPPDVEVRQDAVSLTKGTDPQLERAVKELMSLVKEQKPVNMAHPPFSSPAIRK